MTVIKVLTIKSFVGLSPDTYSNLVCMHGNQLGRVISQQSTPRWNKIQFEIQQSKM